MFFFLLSSPSRNQKALQNQLTSQTPRSIGALLQSLVFLFFLDVYFGYCLCCCHQPHQRVHRTGLGYGLIDAKRPPAFVFNKTSRLRYDGIQAINEYLIRLHCDFSLRECDESRIFIRYLIKFNIDVFWYVYVWYIIALWRLCLQVVPVSVRAFFFAFFWFVLSIYNHNNTQTHTIFSVIQKPLVSSYILIYAIMYFMIYSSVLCLHFGFFAGCSAFYCYCFDNSRHLLVSQLFICFGIVEDSFQESVFWGHSLSGRRFIIIFSILFFFFCSNGFEVSCRMRQGRFQYLRKCLLAFVK